MHASGRIWEGKQSYETSSAGLHLQAFASRAHGCDLALLCFQGSPKCIYLSTFRLHFAQPCERRTSCSRPSTVVLLKGPPSSSRASGPRPNGRQAEAGEKLAEVCSNLTGIPTRHARTELASAKCPQLHGSDCCAWHAGTKGAIKVTKL